MENFDISERLQALRYLRGYTINHVAKALNRVPNTIINWESGRVSPDIKAVHDICKFYEIRADELLGWEPSPELDQFISDRHDIIVEINKVKEQQKVLNKRLLQLTRALQRRTIYEEGVNMPFSKASSKK